MDELIEWSEELKMFSNSKTLKDLLREDTYDEHEINEVEYFHYIRKTDINNEKIYADCSVVEIKYNTSVSLKCIIGTFKYNSDCLCYEFINSDSKSFTNKIVRFDEITFNRSHLKIIGTLQENPELVK